VRMAEGKPQVYGCVHVDDGQGGLVPYPIEDPEGVEARRAAVGLPPLSEKTAELKARVAREAEAGGWKLEAGGKMPEQEQRFVVTEAWRAVYPGAAVGVLALTGVANPAQHPALDARKAALEQSLRERYGGLDRAALAQLPVLQAYAGYYKRFKKTYHVGLQLESVVFKGKSLPNVAALVEAMFMAELQDLLLTAGHDLDRLALPLTLDIAQGTETYILLRGDPQTLKAGDMFIRDGDGVISSIIYGPDRRTQITPDTRAVVFTVYAPPGVGVEAVETHLDTQLTNVRVITPEAAVVHREVIAAG
jgi:DNA/RNA-binding domain of Phe-tRNA-synthetase-like protein